MEPAAEETVRQEFAVAGLDHVGCVRGAPGRRYADQQQQRQGQPGQQATPAADRLEGLDHRAAPPLAAPSAAAGSSPRVAKEMFQMSACRQRSMTPTTLS